MVHLFHEKEAQAMVHFNNEWDELLKDEFKKDYYLSLRQFLKAEYSSQTIYPPMNDIFNALKYTSYSDIKAVILGQDPYHGPGQAHGMAFSVQQGVQPPPSLCNIFHEMESDIGIAPPQSGCLIPWAKQGVLLLNTVLTVRKGQAFSHRGKGWETFTDAVIKLINQREKPVIFLLWGRPAQEKRALLTNPAHHILTAPHPSPLSASRGFFGCRHFSKTNSLLQSMGQSPINWQL